MTTTRMEFVQAVANGVEGASVKVVEKANGVQRIGIQITTGNICPIIYVDDMFDQGASVADGIQRVEETISTNNPEMKFDITNYNEVKGHLKARLYNIKTKADVYRSAKSYGFYDLKIIPYVNDIIENGSVKVTNSLIENWGVTAEEVIDTALNNSRKDTVIMSMTQMLEALGMPLGNDDVPMYVVTNKEKAFGAISVLFAKEQLNEIFPNGYTVLPSSIHEVIVVDSNSSSGFELASIVSEINSSQVAPDEVLSDNVYKI